MSILRILFAIALLMAGAFLPAAGSDPAKAPAGTIGMDHEVFTVKDLTVHRGETVTLVNDSRWMHIIGPGDRGSLEEADGLPMHERVLMPTNDHYTTARWDVPGTYHLTCSMHPEMNVKIVVTE